MTKLAKFDFQQGFHRETTQYAEEGRWYDGNRVRFRAGKPENMRGYETRAEGIKFDGSARALITWSDSDSNARAIFGTPDKLYEHDGDQIYDITPITTAVALTNCFGTSAGETRVCCSDTNHDRVAGDYVYFTATSAIGSSNVSLAGNVYPVTSVISSNVFTISVTVDADSTENAKGKATFNYYIPTGYSVRAAGTGYGAGKYNATDPTSVGISKITTNAGSALVTVSADAAHNGSANDLVFFKATAINVVPATVGGNVILTKPSMGFGTDSSGVSVGGPEFAIVSVASTQFIVSIKTNASASGDVTSNINMAANIYEQTTASGGRGWNSPADAAAGIQRNITQWSLDNWGEDVIANRRGEGLFYFDTPDSGDPSRATSVTTSPVSVNSIIVSPNDRHLVALGTNEYSATATVSGAFNPMLVRWSDQDDRTQWNPLPSTTSGEVVLTDGTKIVGAVRSKNAINIWTDNSLWSMEFVGGNFVFRFQQVGTNCGLIAPHAAIDYNGVTYWMGYDNFYRNTGAVQLIPCSVRRYIFDDINSTYYDKIYVGINSEFKEIIWLYPSSSSTECDKYVIFNPEDNYWVYGDMIFTTFADKAVFGNTITTGVTVAGNNIYNNEPPDRFTDSNGDTLISFIESADFEVDDGNAVMFMNKLIPDYDLSTGQLKMKLITKSYPESTSSVTKQFDIYNNTPKVNLRARGRQAKVRVSCNSNNASWRWGSLRLGLQGDGER